MRVGRILRMALLAACAKCAMSLGVASFGAAIAWAHGPAPSALEALTTEPGDTMQPAWVRTSIGLARHSGAEEYAYGCPMAWGGDELAPSAAAGALLVGVATNAGPMVSFDGACTFAVGDLGVEGQWQAVDVVALGDEGLVFALRRLDAQQGGAAWWVGADGHTELLALWSDVRPDAVTAWEHAEAASGFVVSAARPKPTLRVAESAGGKWKWEELPLADVAGFPADPSRVELRGSRPDESWLLVAVEAGRTLWRGLRTEEPRPGTPTQFSNGQALDWTAEGAPTDGLHGPVWWRDAWWSLRDVQLWRRAPLAAEWSSQGFVDWVCLSIRSHELFACGLDELLHVELDPDAAVDGLPPGFRAQVAFDIHWLTGPDPTCKREGSAAFECQADWVHFGAEAGLDVIGGTGGTRADAGGADSMGADSQDDGAADHVDAPGSDASESSDGGSPADSGSQPAGSDGGCRAGDPVSPGSSAAWWSLLVLACASRRRPRTVVVRRAET